MPTNMWRPDALMNPWAGSDRFSGHRLLERGLDPNKGHLGFSSLDGKPMAQLDKGHLEPIG